MVGQESGPGYIRPAPSFHAELAVAFATVIKRVGLAEVVGLAASIAVDFSSGVVTFAAPETHVAALDGKEAAFYYQPAAGVPPILLQSVLRSSTRVLGSGPAADSIAIANAGVIDKFEQFQLNNNNNGGAGSNDDDGSLSTHAASGAAGAAKDSSGNGGLAVAAVIAVLFLVAVGVAYMRQRKTTAAIGAEKSKAEAARSAFVAAAAAGAKKKKQQQHKKHAKVQPGGENSGSVVINGVSGAAAAAAANPKPVIPVYTMKPKKPKPPPPAKKKKVKKVPPPPKPLPAGWKEELDEEGDRYFVFKSKKVASYEDPRDVQSPTRSEVLTELLWPPAPLKEEPLPWKIGPCKPSLYATMDKCKEHPSVVIEEVRNNQYNRYMDMLPNPRTKVVLPVINNQVETGYVNANYVRGADKDPQKFIAAMAPMSGHQEQFWRMIWQCKVTEVVMVTGLIEKGKTKCPPYWPQSPTGKQSKVKHQEFTVKNAGVEQFGKYQKTTLVVTKAGEPGEHTLSHWWYTAWPDHGVPTLDDGSMDTDGILEMIAKVQKETAAAAPSRHFKSPQLVHCSAGVGRTGVCIALQHGMELLQKESFCDPLEIISTIRNDRCLMVQQAIQYQWLHAAIMRWANLQGQEITKGKKMKKPKQKKPPSAAKLRKQRHKEKRASVGIVLDDDGKIIPPPPPPESESEPEPEPEPEPESEPEDWGDGTYTVKLMKENGPLGMNFELDQPDHNYMSVKALKDDGVAYNSGEIDIGMLIVGVNGTSVHGAGKDAVRQLIAQDPDKVVITFADEPQMNPLAVASEAFGQGSFTNFLTSLPKGRLHTLGFGDTTLFEDGYDSDDEGFGFEA